MVERDCAPVCKPLAGGTWISFYDITMLAKAVSDNVECLQRTL